MGYFAQQSLDLLNPELTIDEQLKQDFPHESIGALRNLAGAFQFSGEDVTKLFATFYDEPKDVIERSKVVINDE